MPAPIDTARRTAIATAIRNNLTADEPRSRAAIAREHGVAASTVRAIAAEQGIDSPFDTTRTRKATESAADRRRAARSRLADDLLDDIAYVRSMLRGPYRKTIVTIDGPERVTEDDATIAAAMRNHLTSVGIAVDKHLALDRHDATTGHDATAGVLAQLADELAAAARPPVTPTEEAP